MRLTEVERTRIITATKDTLRSGGWHLYLFGSRTNDALRGGDIDLLILTDNSTINSQAHKLKTDLLVRIKDGIGEQKIDLVLESKENLPNNAFVSSIMPTAVILAHEALRDFSGTPET